MSGETSSSSGTSSSSSGSSSPSFRDASEESKVAGSVPRIEIEEIFHILPRRVAISRQRLHGRPAYDSRQCRISGFSSQFTYAKLKAIANTFPFPKGTVFTLPDERSCSGDDFSPYFVMSRSALEGGFRLPMHPFIRGLLRKLDVAPGQIHPNFWRSVIAYIIHAQDCGLRPLIGIFLAIFGIRQVPKEVRIYALQSGVKNPWKFPSNVSEYRTEWFLIRSPLVNHTYTLPRPLDHTAKPKFDKSKVQRLKDRYLRSFDSPMDFDRVVTPAFLEMRGLSLCRDILSEFIRSRSSCHPLSYLFLSRGCYCCSHLPNYLDSYFFLAKDFSIFFDDASPDAGLPPPLEVEQTPAPEGRGEHLQVGQELIDLGDPVSSPVAPASRCPGGSRSPGKSSRTRKERGQSPRKSKGKEVTEPPVSNSRVPILLPGEEAAAFFSEGGDRLIPLMPTAFARAVEGGARGGMSLSIMLIQDGMSLGGIFTDVAGQQDDLISAQARARDFKGQAAQLKKELEKSRRDQKNAQEELTSATQRVAELEEELRTASADHQRLTELEEELGSVRANHQRELDSARERAVHDYVAGYRYHFRADFGKNFNGGLLFRVFSTQARRQGLENFSFDPMDFCGYDSHCPAYIPPPVGVFEDDGEDPLEAWDVPFPASETGILPDKKALLPPRPLPKLITSTTTSSIRYERSEGNKRRVVCEEPPVDDTQDEDADAEMADAEADVTTPQASAH